MTTVRLYWNLLKNYIHIQYAKVWALSAFIVLSIGLQLVKPQILRRFIDEALGTSPTGNLAIYGLWYIGAALVAQTFVALTRYLGVDIGWVATNRLREDLTLHCLRLDMAFHKKRTSGELIERIDGDVNLLSNFFSKFTADVLSNLLLLLGAVILLFRESYLVGLSTGTFAVAALALLIYLQAIASARYVKVRQSSAEYFGFVGEVFLAREDVKANGATNYVLRRVTDLIRSWSRSNWRAGIAGYSMWVSNILVFAIGHIVALGIGAYMWSRQQVTVGTVYVIYQYVELMRWPVEEVRQQLQDMQRASAGIKRINEILAESPSIVDGEGKGVAPGALSVELCGVDFEYDAGDAVLKDISLSIGAGRVLGVLGRTGSGKTTLASLLGRLYDVTNGSLLLGGHRIDSFRLEDLRSRVAVVTQHVQLFQGSVRDNVSLFDSSVPDSLIHAVLLEIGLGAWLECLPQGLDTIVGGQTGLSAGQAQLLAFARVMLRNPGLVVLDEASSRLDPATESTLGEAITKLLTGRTGVVVAHRLSTVQMTDDIMILDGGRIAEFGPREALAGDPNSRFYKLLQAGMEELLA